MYENFIIDNFLSETELNSFTYNNKEEFKSSTGNLTLYYQKLLTSISVKISKHIGKFSVRDAHIYDLKQPYRLHCDSGKTKTFYYTIIVPLDKQPQGGIFVMDQWADTTYSLDEYYTQDWKSVLSFEERKEKIKKFDSNISLPDSLDFKHIKDKRGFNVKEYFKYNYNQAIMFPSKFFHCSQNIENFTNKKSLAVFTDVR